MLVQKSAFYDIWGYHRGAAQVEAPWSFETSETIYQ